MARTTRHPDERPDLRPGVFAALTRLGAGFLADAPLRERLAAGALTPAALHRQLLRLVLRLAFLRIAEARELLHADPRAPAAARYRERHGLARLRGHASTGHALWPDLRSVFAALDDGDPARGLPALGGPWRPDATPDLDAAALADADLLAALAALDRLADARPVPWDSLDAEALGWAYEALLDRAPDLDLAARRYDLAHRPGRARASGSYYTPPALVAALLDVALDPLIAERTALAADTANAAPLSDARSSPAPSLHSPAPDLSVHSPAPDRSVHSSPPALSVHSSLPALSVHSPPPDLSVHSSPPDLSFHSSPPDLSVHSSLPDLSVHSSPPDLFIQSPAPLSVQSPAPLSVHSSLPDLSVHSSPPDLSVQSPAPLSVDSSIDRDPAAPLLALRVCDPACGAGHFLVAAARRLARAVAALRAPDAPDHRRALHDVVARCVHGVDLDPDAVELCKFTLWIECLDPTRPLPYLDHRIQPGDALVGAAPEALAGGVPGSAFLTIEGDDPEAARALRRRNTRTDLPLPTHDLPAALLARHADLEPRPDDTRADLRARERLHASLRTDPDHRAARRTCDLWCAAFVWPKTAALAPHAPTDRVWRTRPVPEHTLAVADELAREFAFFHWHLAFPRALAAGGFDLVLGNPPWETLSPDAKEFFAADAPQLRTSDRAAQQRLLRDLLAEPALAARWTRHRRRLYALAQFFRSSGRYRLHADGNLAKGDLNLYRQFVELALALTRPGGSTAQLVPEGLVNGPNCTAIRRALFERHALTDLLGFENTRGRWFPGVHTAAKFTLYAARAGGPTHEFAAAFNLRGDADLAAARRGALRVPVAAVRALAPDTLAVLELHGPRDLAVAAALHARWPRFGASHRRYMRELDMGNDRERFGAVGLPLYEGRMIAAYDHRARGWLGGRGRSAEWCDYAFDDPAKAVRPQWRVDPAALPRRLGERTTRYRLGFCDVASPSNERSLVAALVPPGCVCGDKVPTIVFRDERGDDDLAAILGFLAAANSFTLDFLVRKQIGLKISYTVLDNLPIPRLTLGDPHLRRLAPLVLRLTCTDRDMLPFWDAAAAVGLVPARGPDELPGLLDPEARAHALAAVEAIVARDLFGLDAAALAHILDAFPVVRRRDERRHGEYRTRRLVLAAHAAA
ncbi:MAG: hypothetical protein JNL82_19675 [Myxococcales bacterium]|nr:hypothetical protein [Myxococcales bacterium]